MDKPAKTALRRKRPASPSRKRAAATATKQGSTKFFQTRGTVYPYGEFPRISHNPSIMGGKACIRGMRVTVGMIAGQIGSGATIEEMLDDFPYLEREDLSQAVAYAAQYVQQKNCPCCGALSLDGAGQYQWCENCDWVDDPAQRADPSLKNLRNAISLSEAKAMHARGEKLPLPHGVTILNLN